MAPELYSSLLRAGSTRALITFRGELCFECFEVRGECAFLLEAGPALLFALFEVACLDAVFCFVWGAAGE